ncbi:MAG: nucleoside triphosphate pyrophosphohydrolase [Acidobacteria bacterium]|nr:nucleoside triphosphate pyrophosphohydrolase [Acidobacteriota bacterium]
MSDVTFETLVQLAATLRGPIGCPWDKEQTYQTVGPMTIEEAYEVLEAIEGHDTEALRQELGDLLFHVVFYSQMAKERGDFTIDDVISYVYNKLVRRHPHVFGDVDASTADEVLRNWEAIKKAEKAERSPEEPPSLLGGVSAKIPALLEAYQLTERASRVGFDWASAPQVMDKVEEEIRELKEAMAEPPPDKQRIKEEIGDLLFVVANLARLLEVDPELALRAANRKFKQRFRHIELQLHKRGRTLEESTLEEMDALWEEAKENEMAESRSK